VKFETLGEREEKVSFLLFSLMKFKTHARYKSSNDPLSYVLSTHSTKIKKERARDVCVCLSSERGIINLLV
jgi:hypothetical protein